MAKRRIVMIDGNEAAASVAHRTNEVIAIYPITPSSNMGEFSDAWSAEGRKNIWGVVPDVVEMQSEAGAAGAVHGALQAGALTTTFTASQGLLLMIPNMYKIAGELTAFSMHVSARTVATHALSIFGDHSDVMACRQIGFAMLSSNSVQEVHDFACIAQAATLESRVPFLHFFDGFRTSHEVMKIEELTNEDLLAMLDPKAIAAHRDRALSPDRPKLRGTAQNPDAFFQAREACNPWFDACPEVVKNVMERFAKLTGRAYRLFDYVGHPQAERVMIMMGSGAEAAHETVEYLCAKGEKIGLVKVRLFRPFSIKDFVSVLPQTVKSIAVMDRTKEPGAIGDPLYLDVITALAEARTEGGLPASFTPVVVGGRYGLSSKEFTPAMVKAVYDELKKPSPSNHFMIGINDDVTRKSLAWDETFSTEKDVFRAVFFGLGADGTVGANKNSIKIIGGGTDNCAQGYFVYDSKKSGAVTISHLRFGARQIRSSYLVSQARFVGCHQEVFLDKYDVLKYAEEGAVFLLNSQYPADKVWDSLPFEVQEQIIAKHLRFYVIDGYSVARDTNMGSRINTIMQTCFFAISGVLPKDEAITKIKESIKKTYGAKGEDVVKANYEAVDHTLARLYEVKVPAAVTATRRLPPVVSAQAPDFVKNVTSMMMAGNGDKLPVSAFVPDGTWPTATTRWEKRNVALEIPIWQPDICIQCNKCTMVCPHAALRAKLSDPAALKDAPAGFKAVPYKTKDFENKNFTIQVAPEDCTGCGLCVAACPGKDKNDPNRKPLILHDRVESLKTEGPNFDFFIALPDIDRREVKRIDVKGSQFFRPLFEFSGACAGCGETPYVKLLTQLFGDRLLIANATGCSSIYGGNLPTCPYAQDKDGRGPAWSNSLFEDAAEFGFGFRLAANMQKDMAEHLLKTLGPKLGDNLVAGLLENPQRDEASLIRQREQVAELKAKLAGVEDEAARRLENIADGLVRKSIWMLGGDGWAYDIGFGGLDHVLANNRDVNMLVLDTEVYSNTGGQASKATPLGAAAKFAASGKAIHKKDLGLMAMSYGHAYVAKVAFGAKDAQTVKAFQEAESFPGPSIIIAYSHCIAHGYELRDGLKQQKLAVDSGVWPLFRFDPRLAEEGKNPLQLDSKPNGIATVKEYMDNETRFRMVKKMNPERYDCLAKAAADYTARQVNLYTQLGALTVGQPAPKCEK